MKSYWERQEQLKNLKQRLKNCVKRMKSWKLEFMNLKRKMIKEVTIDEEKIVIDFAGAPFWKYYALQLYFLICHRKRLVDYIETI